jgi:hypothetical protein
MGARYRINTSSATPGCSRCLRSNVQYEIHTLFIGWGKSYEEFSSVTGSRLRSTCVNSGRVKDLYYWVRTVNARFFRAKLLLSGRILRRYDSTACQRASRERDL